MTQMPTERRNASGQFTWLWMVASVLVVAGFMYWLGATSEPSGPVVMESEDAGGANASGVMTVALDELAAGVGGYLGANVRLEGIQVASRLGDHAFWTATSAGMPFLVRLAPTLVADSFAVEGGDTVTVIGSVSVMSDSILGAWEQEGVLTDAGQRAEAEFATSFLQATHAVKVGAEPEARQ